MSISGIAGTDAASALGGWRSPVRQARKGFEDIAQALQANDLAGAQQAYSALQQIQSGGRAASSMPDVAMQKGLSPFAAMLSDWTAFGQALQSGDVQAAKQSFEQLNKDALALHQRRHPPGVAGVAASTGTALAGVGNATVKDDLQALQSALKSGDTTSASDLLTRLIQDLQKGGGHHRRNHAAPDAEAAASRYQTASRAVASVSSSGASLNIQA